MPPASFVPVLVLALLVLSGCTWVKLTEEGQAVTLVESADEIGEQCQLVGRTTSISKASVGGIERNSKKFLTELQTLARNHAGSMNGNVIIAEGQAEGDRQTFKVYQCR